MNATNGYALFGTTCHQKLGLGFVTDIIQIEVPCVSDMVGGHECH